MIHRPDDLLSAWRLRCMAQDSGTFPLNSTKRPLYIHVHTYLKGMATMHIAIFYLLAYLFKGVLLA